MAELSRPWDGTATGDATEAPYDAASEWARVNGALSGADGVLDSNRGGVVTGAVGDLFAGEELRLTTPTTASPLEVVEGVAVVDGTVYINTAAVQIAIPTPAALTRIDRIVLRKDFVLQTVRLTRRAGTEGGGAPALVQTPGVTWDIPLYQASITTLGVITVTDQRQFIGVYRAIARASNTTPNIASGAAAAKFSMNTAVAADGITHDTANNRLTASQEGEYFFAYSVSASFSGTPTGYLQFGVRITGGATQVLGNLTIANGNPKASASGIFRLGIGDYIEVWYDGTTLAGGTGPFAVEGRFVVSGLQRQRLSA